MYWRARGLGLADCHFRAPGHMGTGSDARCFNLHRGDLSDGHSQGDKGVGEEAVQGMRLGISEEDFNLRIPRSLLRG